MRSEARINEISIRGITEVRCSDTEKSAMGASSLYSESSKANLLSVSVLPNSLPSAHGPRFLMLSQREAAD